MWSSEPSDMNTEESLQADEAQRNRPLAIRRLARSPSGISTLAQALIRKDCKQWFAENCEKIYELWTLLLKKTSLPHDATCTDGCVGHVVSTLGGIITKPESLYQSRLAYVQLTRIVAALNKVVKMGRRDGLVEGKSGQRNATVITNMFLSDASEPKRFANRWATLPSTSPLLLFVFTELAEQIVAKTSITNAQLQTLSEEVFRICPPELIHASSTLQQYGELAVRFNIGDDSKLTQDVLKHVKMALA
ncbi:hypothetical protein HD806DRAFT_487743 [Xylariaceae sp. AK1471]|nr:hypothetical protein HD806DRAFT_487743 [Xylariaceae sp. AK1471]